MSAHKITPSNPRIASLLADVGRGNIKIPNFQRDYVWKDEQIVSLLDSIYRGYPVGSLLLWSTKEKLAHERDVGGFMLPNTDEDYPVHYVLDGQQRLTTLYGVFHSDSKTSDAELAARFNIVFAPQTEEFLHASAADPATTINLRTILDTTRLLAEMKRFNTSDQDVIGKLVEQFKDYEFPVVTIKDRTNQEVCRVFQRINSSGTRLSTLELLTAWTWSDQFDLRTEIEQLIDDLADHGYEGVDGNLVMRCLASLVTDGIEADALVDVAPDELIGAMKKLTAAMAAVVDFLCDELHIRNFVFVPFPIMLVPLTRFFAEKPKPTADQRASLKRWFWNCSFTQRYKAGTNAFVMEDIAFMTNLAAGQDVFSSLKATIDPDLFQKAWRINSTAAKAAICLLAQLRPRSFLSGAPLKLSKVMSAYNAREFHHIYPKAHLAAKGIPFHQSNVIANICMLSASDNNAIKDRSPSVYFRDIPSARKKSILRSALIPDDADSGKLAFDMFLAMRANEMARAAERLIAGKPPIRATKGL